MLFFFPLNALVGFAILKTDADRKNDCSHEGVALIHITDRTPLT